MLTPHILDYQVAWSYYKGKINLRDLTLTDILFTELHPYYLKSRKNLCRLLRDFFLYLLTKNYKFL